MGLFLAMYGNKVNIEEALFLSVFAMILVFLVLLIISYLIDITAFFINGPKKKAEKKLENIEKKACDVKSVSKDKESDLVVVIAGAIAAYLGTSADNVVIKSIRRIPQSDTPWTGRGLLSQIKP